MFHSSTVAVDLFRTSGTRASRRLWSKLSCTLFGHKVSNVAFAEAQSGSSKRCTCGVSYLDRSAETRVSHTVSCFMFGHNYVRIAERAGHNEYVCTQCGHPLLFSIGHDPYVEHMTFKKKVRYLCNLFGHRVHHVIARNGHEEYACDCGHSFLKPEAGRAMVKHPLVCLFAGHFLRFTERRGNYDEYLCRNCGHTFYFVVTQ